MRAQFDDQLTEKDEKIGDLEERVERVEDQLTQKDQIINQLNNTIAEMKGRFKDQLETLKEENSDLKEMIRLGDGNLDQLSTKLNITMDAVIKLYKAHGFHTWFLESRHFASVTPFVKIFLEGKVDSKKGLESSDLVTKIFSAFQILKVDLSTSKNLGKSNVWKKK